MGKDKIEPNSDFCRDPKEVHLCYLPHDFHANEHLWISQNHTFCWTVFFQQVRCLSVSTVQIVLIYCWEWHLRHLWGKKISTHEKCGLGKKSSILCFQILDYLKYKLQWSFEWCKMDISIYFSVHIFLVTEQLYPQDLISLRIQNSAHDLHITEKNCCSYVQRKTAVNL